MTKYPKYIKNMLKNAWTKSQTEDEIKNIETRINYRLALFVRFSSLYGMDDNEPETSILEQYKQLVQLKQFLGVLENAIH